MKYSKTIYTAVALTLMIGACDKDKDKVAELEKEVLDAESKMVIPDSAGGADTATVQRVESSTEYAKTPDIVPSETSPEPIAALTSTPSPTAGGIYTVQVASATDMTYANHLAERYRQRGYETFVTAANIDGVNYFRVRVGSYETVAQARSIGLELQDRYSISFWIALHNQ